MGEESLTIGVTGRGDKGILPADGNGRSGVGRTGETLRSDGDGQHHLQADEGDDGSLGIYTLPAMYLFMVPKWAY